MADASEEKLSRHPADVLIRELIVAKRAADSTEIQDIVDRMGTAPFHPHRHSLQRHIDKRKREEQ